MDEKNLTRDILDQIARGVSQAHLIRSQAAHRAVGRVVKSLTPAAAPKSGDARASAASCQGLSQAKG